jgi:hypothetical protein
MIIAQRVEQSFAHSIEISKTFGVIDSVIVWCKSEMQGDWRWQLIDTSSDQRPGRYMFYFDSAVDFFAFTMKWS